MKIRLIFISLLLLTFSCKSAKTVSGSGALNPKIGLKKLVKSHEQAAPKFKTLQARLAIDYTRGNSTQSHTVTYRMEKDKVIWMSATLALVRAKITPEKVQFYSKIDNTYFDGDFTYLSELLGTDINFKKLQNLLLGQTLYTLNTNDYEHEVYGQSYMIKPKMQTDIFEAFFMLNPKHFKLNSQQFGQSSQNRLLQIDYLSYQDVEGETLPQQTKIIALESNKETTIELEFKSVKLNEELRFPFRIPQGFTQIEIE